LKTGFDDKTGTGKFARGILTNRVSQNKTGGSFSTTGHIEITPLDLITIRTKALS
jgi:hypothetical protein